MTVTVYRSSDTSAPVLRGTVGDLVNLLDKVLVDGYGAKPPLGWTKPYTGTNAASYRQPAGTTNGFYIDIDDNNPNTDTTISGRTARIRCFETMTALATGTGQFPTTSQSATSLQIVKSTEASGSTAVSWVIVGTNKFFYMWVKPISSFIGSSGIGGDIGHMWGFGDFPSYKAGDVYNTCIVASATAGASASSPSSEFQMAAISTALQSTTTNMFIARSYNQRGTSTNGNKLSDYSKNGQAAMMGGGAVASAMAYPNPSDQGIYTAPVWVGEPNLRVLRGVLPGIHCPLHSVPLYTGDQFTGATGTALDGKTLEAFSTGWSTTAASSFGQIFLEVSNTW